MDRQQDLEEAVRHLELSVRQSPRNPRYAALLGEACLIQRDADAALAPLQAAFVGESHPRTAWLLATALFQLGNHAEAEKYATVALEENQGFARAHLVRGEARRLLERFDGALEDFREACELAPDNDAHRMRLANLLVERAFQGEADARRALLQEARSVLARAEPEGESESWRYLLGCTLLELDEPRAALEHLERTGFPTAPEVALRRGLAHLKLAEVDLAAAAFQQARVDPELMSAADRFLEAMTRDDGSQAVTAVSRAPRPVPLDTDVVRIDPELDTTGHLVLPNVAGADRDEASADGADVDADTARMDARALMGEEDAGDRGDAEVPS